MTSTLPFDFEERGLGKTLTFEALRLGKTHAFKGRGPGKTLTFEERGLGEACDCVWLGWRLRTLPEVEPRSETVLLLEGLAVP